MVREQHHGSDGILGIVIAGTSATRLARKWESAVLVDVDNDTLRRIINNPEAMAAVERIEGCHDPEQIRLELRDRILERVLPKLGQIHKRGNPRRELDQLFLNLLAFRLVLFLLGNKFLLLLCRQILARCLVLEFLDLFAFVNNSVDDVITKRPPGLSVPEKQGSAGPFANRSATGKANLFDAESVDG